MSESLLKELFLDDGEGLVRVLVDHGLDPYEVFRFISALHRALDILQLLEVVSELSHVNGAFLGLSILFLLRFLVFLVLGGLRGLFCIFLSFRRFLLS